MREKLFKWVKETFGETNFLGFVEYTESTVNRMLKDTRIYRITEIKFVIGLPYEEILNSVLSIWQNELKEILQVTAMDKFSIEVDHSKRLVTPDEVAAKLLSTNHLIEKKSLLLRVNIFKKRPYKEK